MKEYIEREALIAEIDDRIADIGFTSPYQDNITLMLEGMARVRDSVEVFPAADVVERKRGEWVKDGDFLICLNCESEINIKNSLGVENRKNFCPNCGNDMREV